MTSIDKFAFYKCNSLTDVYYNGSEAEWDNISIGVENRYLINAVMYYIDSPKTITAVSSDGKTFTVKPFNITAGNVVILMLYDNGKFVQCQKMVYDGVEPIFTTSETYTSAKVAVWETLDNVNPITDIEIVK